MSGTMVSVIIIFLDAGRFLQEAIDSVTEQTHTDWELLLIDDGSSDAGSAVAQAAAAASDRVFLHEHPGHLNLGTSASRNLGLELARGDYILYLDADDILFPDTLRRLASVLDRTPSAGLAFGATLWWFWAPEFASKRDHVNPFLHFAGRRVAPPRFLTAMVRTEDIHPANCSTMLRRSVMQKVGGFDESFRGMYEDTVMLAKVLLISEAAVLDDVLSAYRMHPASQCHLALADGDYNNTAPNRSRERYLRWLKAYLKAQRAGNLRLTWTLARELWLYDRRMLHAFVESRYIRRLIDFLRSTARGEVSDNEASSARSHVIVQALQIMEQFYRRHCRLDEADTLRHRLRSWDTITTKQ